MNAQKQYTGISRHNGLTVRVNIIVPTDLPMTDDALDARANALATLGLGSFGLMPTEASAFLTAVLRTLRAEFAAAEATEP